jgi:hypothetical protein
VEVLVAASSGTIAGFISGVIGSLIAPWIQWAMVEAAYMEARRRGLVGERV